MREEIEMNAQKASKKLKKRFALLLVAVMISTLMPTIGFAEDMAVSDGSNPAAAFTDMPDNWSAAALQNAVANGILKGENGKLRPGDPLTRAEMASIINRAFGAEDKASLSDYKDVTQKAWYYEEMSKAIQMGTFLGGGDGLLRPRDPITRQEVFVVIARAFKLSGGNQTALSVFRDQSSISNWAKGAAAAMVDAGYLQGADGKLNPQGNITRAEFAKIMDNMLSTYIRTAETVTEIKSGNVMINVPGVTLKNLEIKGDLIIGDGVGQGNVTLENVAVTGRLIVRGGGENSILITGDSRVDSIIIVKIKGKVRVFTADGTEVGTVIADGSDDIILEGSFASVVVKSNNVIVNAVKADIGDASMEGNNTILRIGSGSSVEAVKVTGNNVTVEGTGSVDKVQVYSSNVTVKTLNTAVTAEAGSTGVDAAGTKVNAGSTVITGPPSSSGGGGSSTPPQPPSDFAGGSGTEASPYQVATAAQLNKVRDHLDKHFIQTADINLGAAPWNEGAGWVPIGLYGQPFSGSYNGNGYEILNLTINNSLLDNAGLFAFASGNLMNILISGGSIQAHDYVGLLAGEMTGTTEACHAEGDIVGRDHIGVLIGHNKGIIRNSKSAGSVTGNNTVGGLAGWNDGSNSAITSPGSISNCYSLASVSGVNTGGLVGLNQNNGFIEKSFSVGSVAGEGGLVGQNHSFSGATVSNSYYDSETSGKSDSDRGTPLTTAQMTQQASFTGWDFFAGTGIWTISTDPASYPYFRWQNGNQIPYPPSDFGGGSGTIADPYQITSADQLDKIRNHLDKHFVQTMDIDLGVAPWNEGAGWTPIGSYANPFSGSYDGDGYEIRNLTINNSNLDMAGLFTHASGTIKNLNFINGSIQADMYAGLLAGEFTGIAEHLSAYGSVAGNEHIGVLVGRNKGVIQECWTSGSASGGSTVGGLAGWNDGNGSFGSATGNISNSYSIANISGTNAGGLVGLNDNGGWIGKCYSAGSVAVGINNGGLVGINQSGSNAFVSYGFYDRDVSGKTDSDKGYPKTTAQMKQESTYTDYDWDFTTIWGINPDVNNGYPFLRWQGFMAGAGTALDPYQVANVDHLNLVRNNLAAHYLQIDDIDLSDIANWEPIGYNLANPQSSQSFTGTYDGNGFIISNLSIQRPADGNWHVGLFARSNNGAVFKGMRLEDVDVSGYMLVGSIVGYLYYGIMENCVADGSVAGGFHTIGGLTGYCHYGTIRQSSFSGTVRAGYGTVGGLTGRTYDGLIEECFSNADVTNLDQASAGGLVGSHEGDTSVIRNCYATGMVTGTDENGGLVGRSFRAIVNCYSTGRVVSPSSEGIFEGGFAGRNYSSITSCYYDSQTSQQSDTEKGTPKTTAEMRLEATFVGWDFDTIWEIGSSYPTLQWEPNI